MAGATPRGLSPFGHARRLLAGLALLLLALPAAGVAQPQKRIALTFDDVPRGTGAFMSQDERTRRLIAGLRAAGVRQAAFFLNPVRLVGPEGASGRAHVDAYVHAGHVIANHSWSHPHLTRSRRRRISARSTARRRGCTGGRGAGRGSATRSWTRAGRTGPSATRSVPGSPRGDCGTAMSPPRRPTGTWRH